MLKNIYTSPDTSTHIQAQNRASNPINISNIRPVNVGDIPDDNIRYIPQGSSLVATKPFSYVD